MPTRQDEYTVLDDNGVPYFLPAPGPYGSAPTQPQAATPPAEDSTTAMALLNPANPASIGLPGMPDFENPTGSSVTSPDQMASINQGRDYRVPPPAGLTPPQPQTAGQARNSAIVGDLAGFSAGGGVLKSHEDTARAEGGVGLAKESAAIANEAYKRLTMERTAAAHHDLAVEATDISKAYEARVSEIHTKSEQRWTDFRKRNDQAAAALVDPKHAFKSMSTLGRAGYMLAFLGAGLEGGNSVATVMSAVDKLVSNDINAQESNIANQRKGLAAEETALREIDSQNKTDLEGWYFARNLRYQALGKDLDAKIASMGAPEAERAGLLIAKAKIQEEVAKGMAVVKNDIEQEKQIGMKHANDMALARLQSSLRINEKMQEDKIAKAGNEQYLPTGTSLGLSARLKAPITDPKTGKVVAQAGAEISQIKLRSKLTPDQVVAANTVSSAAQLSGESLNAIKDELGKMDTQDLLRGGTAEFKSWAKNLIMAVAQTQNPGRAPTDADARIAAQSLGLDVDGTLGAAIRQAFVVGGTLDNAKDVIDLRLRNLSQETEMKLQPYLDPDDAQNLDIRFTPSLRSAKPPGGGPLSHDQTVTSLSGGADVSDLQKDQVRPPLKTAEELAKSLTPQGFARYDQEKAAGALPVLPDREERVVSAAVASYQKSSPDDILDAMRAAERNKVSPEAKYRIRVEAFEALTEARKRQEYVDNKFKAAKTLEEQGIGGLNTDPWMKEIVLPGGGGETDAARWERWKALPEYRAALEAAGIAPRKVRK